jgi:flavin reductase (DIM6/NTAB) family NADH-FMN oxidoreductase RutF
MNKVGDDIGQLFRLAMRRFPAAVTIVTTRYQGEDVGMTATAVTSLSMDPPSLLLCVNRGNGFHTPIEENQDFCINILREGQHDISTNFGGGKPAHERFAVGEWRDQGGIPYLADAQASIFCHKTALFGHTTHSIVVFEVTGLLLQDDIAPLLYVDGRYCLVTPLPV